MSEVPPDNTRSEVSSPSSAQDTATVEVRTAAEASQLSVLRAVMGDLAMRADFDIDSIADLRLAVDEACSSLVRLAADRTELRCEFRTSPDALAVSVRVRSASPTAPRTETFSWRVLDALVDEARTTTAPDSSDDGLHEIGIDLHKRRTVQG